MADHREVTFGRLTMEGESLPGGSWVLAERTGTTMASFIVLDDVEAADLRDQMIEKLGGLDDFTDVVSDGTDLC